MLPPERLNACLCLNLPLFNLWGQAPRSCWCQGWLLAGYVLCLEKVVVLVVPIVDRLRRGQRTGTVSGWGLKLSPKLSLSSC